MLKGRGHRFGINRVERVMREAGIRVRRKRRFKATTESKHSMPVATSLLARNITPPSPDKVWTGDVTYMATGQSWLYLPSFSTWLTEKSSAGRSSPG